MKKQMNPVLVLTLTMSDINWHQIRVNPVIVDILHDHFCIHSLLYPYFYYCMSLPFDLLAISPSCRKIQ